MRTVVMFALLLVVACGLPVAWHFLAPGRADSKGTLEAEARTPGESYREACRLYATGRFEEALGAFVRLEKEAARGNLRNWARLHAADCWLELAKAGDEEALAKAVSRYSQLIDTHPPLRGSAAGELADRAASGPGGLLLPAYQRLAESLVLQGDPGKACEVLEAGAVELGKVSGAEAVVLALGKAKLELGAYGEAAEVFGKLAKDFPASDEAEEAALLRGHALAMKAGCDVLHLREPARWSGAGGAGRPSPRLRSPPSEASAKEGGRTRPEGAAVRLTPINRP